MAIGWFGEDVIDAAGSVVSDVAGAVGSLPGVSQLAEAMGDFAKTAVGQIVLRAISDSLFGSVAFVVGPQLASLTWSIPGLMRGDSFDKAWLDSFKLRVEQTAEILGGDAAAYVAAQLPIALSTLGGSFLPTEVATWGEAELAKRAGDIREDVSRIALDKWNSVSLFNPDDFDPSTGKRYGFADGARGFASFGAAALRNDVAGRIVTLTAADRLSNANYGSYSSYNGLHPSVLTPKPATYAAPRPRPPPPRNGMGANLALGGVVLAAAAALVLWYRS